MSRYYPAIVSYLFIFYLMTIPFWTDLLTRLGPSEIYGVIAIPLFIYGMQARKLWMIVLGYLVAVGAKENFLILFPVIVLYAGYLTFLKTITRKEILAMIGLTTYTFFIVGAIQLATSQAGADIYGATISYSARFAKLYSYKRYIVESRHLQIALLIFFAAVVKLLKDIYLKGFTVLKNNAVVNHLLVASTVSLAIVSQYIFYDSQIPSNIRYDYPVMLLFPILQMIAIGLLLTLIPSKINGARISVLANLGLVALMLALIFRRGYAGIQTQSLKVVASSQQFDLQLENAVKRAREKPDNVLVFVSKEYYSFEPIISVSRYLTAKEIQNKMILDYTKELEVNDPLGLELESKFAASMEGRTGADDPFIRFSPANQLSKSCYSITFGPALPLPDCPEIARF